MPANSADYTSVTEVTGNRVTAEQLERMLTRYRFAASYASGKDVLEVACGSGQGLGYLARAARKVVGGDFDPRLVEMASSHYSGRPNITVLRLDAHALPFSDASFDLVILYEAVYYLSEPLRFFDEAKRVLRPGGVIIVCSANKEWSGFNPSPMSHGYYSASELHSMLSCRGFKPVELFADCPIDEESLMGKAVGLVKQAAVKLHLIPKTMKAKEMLKRIFHGRLTPLPPEITDSAAEVSGGPVGMEPGAPVTAYKVVFAVGRA